MWASISREETPSSPVRPAMPAILTGQTSGDVTLDKPACYQWTCEHGIELMEFVATRLHLRRRGSPLRRNMARSGPRQAVTRSRRHVVFVVTAVAVQHEVRTVVYGRVVSQV
jgi:hypothetical protein